MRPLRGYYRQGVLGKQERVAVMRVFLSVYDFAYAIGPM